MKILKFSLGQLQVNCYILTHDSECIIIDPADEASFLLEEIQRRHLTLQALIATHGHFDHVMAAGEIQKSFNVPFYIHAKDMFLIDRLNETAEYFLGYNPYSLKPDHTLFFDEGSLSVGSWLLNVVFTPGHTPGSCSFYLRDKNILFSGDTLFKGNIGKYDFSYSRKNDLKKSLEKILLFPDKTAVYPGHGEDTTIGDEKENNVSQLID